MSANLYADFGEQSGGLLEAARSNDVGLWGPPDLNGAKEIVPVYK